MMQKPDILELDADSLILLFHQVAEHYKTTVFELLACYFYYLLDGNIPVGYPKEVIKKSEARPEHYKDPRYVVVDDVLKVNLI